MFSVALFYDTKDKDLFSLPPQPDRVVQWENSALALEEKDADSRRKEASSLAVKPRPSAYKNTWRLQDDLQMASL